MSVCVAVCVYVGRVFLPVLCFQGAGQVFGVGVTERVGQTVLVADFLTVGLGLRGAALALRPTHTGREDPSPALLNSPTAAAQPAVLNEHTNLI